MYALYIFILVSTITGEAVPLLIVLYFKTNSFNPVPDSRNEKNPFVGSLFYLFSTLEAILHTWSTSAIFTMKNAFFLC